MYISQVGFSVLDIYQTEILSVGILYCHSLRMHLYECSVQLHVIVQYAYNNDLAMILQQLKYSYSKLLYVNA